MTHALRLRIRCGLLICAGVLSAVLPASARIIRSRPSAASASYEGAVPSVWAPLYAFVLGGGFEYERSREQTEYGFPFLLEYNVTEKVKLTLEPKYTSLAARSRDARSVKGFGDLETSLAYEFLRERRYRPALSVEGRIKWPTASDPDLGERRRDYTLGLIASKDLVFVDVDLNVLYTFVGEREREDTIEVSLAAEWHVNRDVDVIAEVAQVTRLGGRDGERGESEATVGLAWHVNKFLKLEQGVVFKERGIWEAVFAWEWRIGGD